MVEFHQLLLLALVNRCNKKPQAECGGWRMPQQYSRGKCRRYGEDPAVGGEYKSFFHNRNIADTQEPCHEPSRNHGYAQSELT